MEQSKVVHALLKVQSQSDCKRMRVGCLITTPGNEIIVATCNWHPMAFGCNGGDNGACGCIHAEVTALLRLLRHDCENWRIWTHLNLWCTHSPCVTCAQQILLPGINFKSLNYLHDYRDMTGVHILTQAGINVVKI